MNPVRTHLNKGGRVVIPASYRRALKVRPGDPVILLLEGNEVRLVPRAQAIKRAQSLVRQFVPKERSLARELIEDRRRETRQENPAIAGAGKK